MKNSQKKIILLTVLIAIVVIAVIIVALLKPGSTSTNNKYEENTVTSIYEDPDNITANGQIGNNNQVSESQNINAAGNTTKPANKNNTDKNTIKEEYDLKNAELIQSQRISSYDLCLYSTKNNGKIIYLFTAEKDDKLFYFDIPGEYIIENIYYANIDGYYGDEVIIHANKNNNSQSDKYQIYVLKITSSGIQTLLNEQQMKSFAQHFSGTPLSNSTVKISNSKTSYSKTIDVEKYSFSAKYWDESGKPKNNTKVISGKNFNHCEPKDVDNDGLYELYCAQYIGLSEDTNCIGYAYTTLKYNLNKNSFEITDTIFYAS